MACFRDFCELFGIELDRYNLPGGGDALFDHLADALPWNGHGTPGGLSVKVSLLLDSRLPSTIDNTIRWRTRILDFRQGGKVGSRTYFLTLPLQHVCFSMNTGDRITVWGARVGPQMKCTIDVSAKSGGAAKHADYGKPGISVDLFAGLGGWSFGHQLATTFGQLSFPPMLIAVEIDRSVAELSGVNLRMKTIDATDFVRDSQNGAITPPCIIIADLDNRSIRGPMSVHNIQVIVGSPSCQPWSGRGTYAGFAHKYGHHILTFLGVCTATMPKLVALENVQGLLRHPQWQLVVQLYKLAGYRLIMAQSEQAPVIPSNRPRSAIIFARSDVHIGLGEQEILTRMTLQPIIPRTLKAWKSIACSLPDDVLGELVLDEERLGIAMNPKFLPNWQRSPYMNQEKIRQLREIDQEDRLGPLMASYAANLSFAAEFLESRGLFIQLVSDCKGHRLLHPGELASALGLPDTVVLPSDIFAAYRVLGNLFVPSHASLQISRLSFILNLPESMSAFRANPDNIVRALTNHGLHFGDTKIIRTGIFLGFEKVSPPSLCDSRISDQAQSEPVRNTPTKLLKPRIEPFPTISPTVSFVAIPETHGNHSQSFAAEPISLYIRSEGKQIGELNLPATISTAQLQEVAMTLWRGTLDLPSADTQIGQIRDDCNRIFAHLIPSEPESHPAGNDLCMQVFARDPHGVTRCIRTTGGCTLRAFAQQVGFHEVEAIKITSCGHLHDLDKTLLEVGIRDGIEVTITSKCRGGHPIKECAPVRIRPHVLHYGPIPVTGRQETDERLIDTICNAEDTWCVVKGFSEAPFMPLSVLSNGTWKTTNARTLAVTLPEHEGIALLTAWDQSGIIAMFSRLGWLTRSRVVGACIQLEFRSQPQSVIQIDLQTMTDLLFARYMQSLALATRVKVSDQVTCKQVKIRSARNFAFGVMLPGTTKVGLVHHAWNLACQWTGLEQKIVASTRLKNKHCHDTWLPASVNQTLDSIAITTPCRMRVEYIQTSAGPIGPPMDLPKHKPAKERADDQCDTTKITISLPKTMCQIVLEEWIQDGVMQIFRRNAYVVSHNQSDHQSRLSIEPNQHCNVHVDLAALIAVTLQWNLKVLTIIKDASTRLQVTCVPQQIHSVSNLLGTLKPPSHFMVDATHCETTPIPVLPTCRDALADAVFCKQIQCIAEEVSRTTLAPQRLIPVKIKTAFGSQIEVSFSRTATLQLIHSVWAIAARLTGITPHIRTVVNARQIMPHVPFHQLTTCATGGKCTIHTLFPLRGGGLPQQCSLEGADQLHHMAEESSL